MSLATQKYSSLLMKPEAAHKLDWIPSVNRFLSGMNLPDEHVKQ